MLLKKIFLLVALAGTFLARAQLFYTPDQSIPVEVNGSPLTMPWAGGLNAPQFNTMDLNGDHHDDLVLFDRTAGKVLTFLNQNGSYQHAPEYESQFPSGINQWMLLRDFNCDGRKDIFTSDPFGMTAFVNITPPGGRLSWRTFNPGHPILTIGFLGNINLQVNGTDIPAIDDVDGDGDLDILDAHFSGIGSLEFHRNMSIENLGRCDSMQFKRVTLTWGNFEECNCGKYLFGPDSTCAKYGGRLTHAAGKSSLTIDLNHDGARELLFSEENCNNLYLMTNTGTRDSAIIHSATTFPSVNPVDLQLFPAPYYEDIDFDGLPDLVVASNVATRNAFNLNFRQSVWLYKNTGTMDLPVFTFIKNNFLQDQMIEVGDNAVPAFFDEDGDGDLDLFIGNYAGINLPAGLTFFRNTGTSSNPSFSFVTDDYANLTLESKFSLKPQFADMNADGKVDLVISGIDLMTTVTSLYYIPNLSSVKLDLAGQPLFPIDLGLLPSENALVVDVNRDGLNDVLVGRATGSVEYWVNNGPQGFVNLALAQPAFLGLTLTTSRQSVAMAAGDLDADGKLDLLWGDQRGTLSFVRDFRSASPAAAEGVFYHNPVVDSAQTPRLGGRSWPAIVSLFNTNRPEIVAGNILGGLHVLKSDLSQDLPAEPVITLHPNPVRKSSDLIIETDRNMEVQLISVLGQAFTEPLLVSANIPFTVSTQGFSPGLYVARFTSKGRSFVRKFVVY